MKRAILAALLVLGTASVAQAGGTTIWPGNGDADSHYLFHLGDPTTSPDPSTAPLRLGDLPQIGTPCILQANGGFGKPTCSSLTGFAAHAPLLLTGPDLTLTLSDGTLSVNANALRRAAIGGDTIIPLGSNTSTFRNGSANSVLGRSGVTPGAIVDLASSATGDAFWNNGTGIQWSAYPYSALTGAPGVATWALGATRFFAADTVAGDDTRTCYSDASQAAAGANACKTLDRMMRAIPRNGMGRFARAEVKGGAYSSDTQFDLSGFSGYKTLVIAVTDTVASAGATAFAGDANDTIAAGMTTAPGMNASGYNITSYTVDGTGNTTAVLQKVGGADPGWSSMPAAPYGYRIRGDVATTTASCRNATGMVTYVTGTNTIRLALGLDIGSCTPTGSDVFYIEAPNFSGPIQTIMQDIGGDGTGNPCVQITGFAFGSMQVTGARVRLSNDTASNLTGTDSALFPAESALNIGSPLFTNVGMGIRIGAGINLTGSELQMFSSSTAGTSMVIINNPSQLVIERSSFSAGIVVYGGTHAGGNNIVETIGTNSSTAHGGDVEIWGTAPSPPQSVPQVGLALDGGYQVGRVHFTNMGAHSAISIGGSGFGVHLQGPKGGVADGNTGVGVDLTPNGLSGNTDGSGGNDIMVVGSPTVTGSGGDIKLPDGTIVTWAQAAAGIIDTQGNRIIGAGTTFPITVLPSTGTKLSGGALTVPNLVGPGTVQASPAGLLSVGATSPIARVDGIATGTAQLSVLNAAPFNDGALVWVDTVGDFFRLAQSALTTTATTVVTASGKPGYQWVRTNTQNRANQLVAAWYLDPLSVVATCSDENTGLSSAVPLCTMSEIARRTAGASYPLSGTACVVYLESSKPTTDRATFNYSVNGPATSTLNPGGFDAPFMVIGVPTDLGFAGVVSSAQNGALGSTQDIHFADSGIPTSFTASGFLATNVIFHKTSGTPGWFWPALDLGSKTLRASQINTGFATYATFSNGDTYRPQSLPNFNATNFPLIVSELPVAAVFGVTVTDAVGSDPAASNPGIMWFEDSFVNLHQHAGWYINDQFLDQQFFAAASYGNRFGGFIYSGLGRATGSPTQWVFKLGSTWLLSDEGTGFTTLEKIKYTIDVSGDGERIQAQFFDNTTSILNLLQGSFANVATIGGSGNSGNIVNVSSAASRVTYTVAPLAGMTSSGTPIQVRGSNYAVSALPVADPTAGAYVVPEAGAVGWGGDLGGSNTSPLVIGLTGGAVDHPIDTLTTGQALTVSAGTGHIVSAPILAAPGSNGIAVWNGSTFLSRTLTNADGTINFTNPDGVAGNPEIHVNAIPESKVTGLTADLAGKVPTTRNINTTAPMTGGGSLAGDLTLAVPNFAGSTAGLVPPSGGSATAFLNGAGAFTTPAGTIYTGLGPIVVFGSTIDCPTCGTSSGSVTGVFGTTGQVNVTPSSPNPVVSLPNVGPGATTTGSAGIASVTTDAQGRIVSMTTNTYQPALSFPPAHYVLDSTGSGVTGDVSFQRDPSTNLVSAIGLAINGASPFPNSALIVNSATNINRDRVQLYLGGGGLPAAGPTGDSTLLGIFPHDTAVEAGVTSGVYSTFRARSLTYTGTGQTITEATGGYFEQPILSGVSGLTFALHAVGTSLITGDFGATGTVAFDSLGGHGLGIVTNDTFGDLRTSGSMAAGNLTWDGAGNIATSAGALMYSKDYYFDIPGALINATSKWLATSNSALLATTAIEYAVPYAVTSVHMFMSGRIMANPIIGGIVPNISINVTKNGTGISGAVQSFGIGVTGNFNGIFVSTTSFAAGDMLGLRVTSNATMGGGNFTGTISFGWDQQM